MKLLPILALVIALLFLLALLSKRTSPSGRIGFPYDRTALLFSAAERAFLGVLDQAVGLEYRVFGKVRVADVAQVKPRVGNSARQAALNRISGKHFDFVICRTSDLGIVCAIELNDRSHAGQRTQKRDEFIVTLCQTIGLPLLQIPAKQAYVLADLRAQFLSAIGQGQIAPQSTLGSL